MKILLGVLMASLVTFIAYKKKSLSLSGAIAAVVLGTGIYFLGGEIPFALMMIFFISSSILSKVKKNSKSFLDKIHEKGDARDYMQVIANGGVALLFLILYKATDNNIFFVASAVSFAASNSDTWASEVGVLSKRRPISIITGKISETGVSGGISLLGTIASLAGATLIGMSYGLLSFCILGNDNNIIKNIIIVSCFGFLGSIIDSILGATVQGQYRDSKTNVITEKSFNENGKNKIVKGYSLINNDIVNMLSNLIVTTLAVFLI